MGNVTRHASLTALMALAGAAHAADEDKNIQSFLVDIAPAPVAAANIVGIAKTGVTDVRTAKDLALVLNPVTEGGGRPSMALTFTPARSSLAPMSGQRYVNGGLGMRLLGSATISYAQGEEKVAEATYRKQAWALETMAYWDVADDPIYQRARKFHECVVDGKDLAAARRDNEKELLKLRVALPMMPDGDAKRAAQARLAELRVAVLQFDVDACFSEGSPPLRWNATKVALSFGQGWVRAGDGPRASLGKRVVFGATWGFADDFALQGSVQRVHREVDPASLSGTPTYSSTNIVGLRLTGAPSRSDTSVRLLAELSRTGDGPVTQSRTAFKHAVGVDAKIARDMWLEFRLGRSRSLENGEMQTSSLMTVNWAPASTLFAR